MKTEEAIEKVKNLNEIFCKETISDIVSALKRGEAFEKMWKELYAEYGMCPIRKNDEEGYMSNILYKILEELEQKYFPRE